MVKCSINKLFQVIYINKLFNQYISIFIQIKLSKFKRLNSMLISKRTLFPSFLIMSI